MRRPALPARTANIPANVDPFLDGARAGAGGRPRHRQVAHCGVPDAPPVIALTRQPIGHRRKATNFSFKASDDYGVAGARAVPNRMAVTASRWWPNLPLPRTVGRKVDQTSYVDLTSHPYAGLTVEGHLEARDAIGQKGLSAPFTFRLPARIFTDPLARALIEQRQHLATADAAGRKSRAADAGCAHHRAGPFL